VYALYGMLVLIWSSTWVAIKIGLEDCPPLLGAGVRFAVAGVLLLGIAAARRTSLRTDARLAIVLALFPFALTYGLIYWGEQYVPSGLAAVLFGVLPLYTALLGSVALPDAPLRGRVVAGILVALGGLALVVFRVSERRPIPVAAQGPVAAHVRTQPPSVASAGAPPSPVEKEGAWRDRGAKPDSKIGSLRGLPKNIRRRTPPRPQPEVTLISRWRSPTEFLLNSPGEQLLRTVPRLDDSLLKIKTVTLDGND
jgi:hypothetical protein